MEKKHSTLGQVARAGGPHAGAARGWVHRDERILERSRKQLAYQAWEGGRTQWGSQEEHRRLGRTWPNAPPFLRAMHWLADPTCKHQLPFSRRIQGSSFPSPTAGGTDQPPGRGALGLGLQRSLVQIPACRAGCLGSNPVSLGTPLKSQIPRGRHRGRGAWHLTGHTYVFDQSGQRRCPQWKPAHPIHQGWFPGWIRARRQKSAGPLVPEGGGSNDLSARLP